MNKHKTLIAAMVAFAIATIVLIVVWSHQSRTQDPAPSFDFEIDTSSPNTAAIPSDSSPDFASADTAVVEEPQETSEAKLEPIIDEVIPKTLPIVENRIHILGKFLFESKLLSKNQKISCASCHEPALQFADGLAQSKGILEVEVGANSPSLIAMGHVKLFPSRTPEGEVRALTLEERCVAPIVNPVEMGSKLEPVLKKLSSDPTARKEFKRAFPNSKNPISEKMIGRALAAFVRKLQPETTPYERFLAGEWGAISSTQKHGIEVFNGRGKCNKCHSGDNFSDGLIHKVSRVSRGDLSQQFDAQRKLIEAIKKHTKKGSDERKELMLRANGEGDDYYSRGTLAQTLPLWDVARTAPYFRDGSAATLSQAIAIHVKELRSVWSPARSFFARRRSTKFGVVRIQIPESLLPEWINDNTPPKPAKLIELELESLVALLEALSPD